MTRSLLDLMIDRPVAGGRMIARHDGRVVLVAGALPGERVRAQVERVSRDVTFASVVDVIDASPDRRDPAADPACGGLDYAHVAYPRQLALKGEVVADAFRRIGKMSLDGAVLVRPSQEDGYRLRARLHVQQRRAGFFRENTHTLCDARATRQLQAATLDAVDATLASLDHRLAECAAVVVSEDVKARDRVVHLEAREGARLDDLAGLALPAGLTGLSTGGRGKMTTIAGSPIVTERAADLFDGTPPVDPATRWGRHAASFFQGNRYLLGDLVGHVLGAGRGDRFVDLYAGVGLFAIALAAAGGRGLAVEGDRTSAADLAANAAPYRDRLRAINAPVENAVAMPLDPPPDVVVLDPPRTGVDAAALAGVIAWASPRIVYVSCDPATLARDAKRLVESGYRLASMQGFDLFPTTAHVEVVAVFDR